MSDYEGAFTAAGAEVLVARYFGSYQGDCWVKVRYQGQTGWLNFSYGSCSGCDSYEASMSWEPDKTTEPAEHAAWLVKLADFGKTYLSDMLTQEQAEAKAAENDGWDMTAEEMVAWLKSEAV